MTAKTQDLLLRQGGTKTKRNPGFQGRFRKKEREGLCSMEGRRQGVMVAPQEIRSPVPHLKQAVG